MDAVMLLTHMNASHGDMKKYKCPNSPHSFLALGEISIHMECHRELQFKCRLYPRVSDSKQEIPPLIVKVECTTSKETIEDFESRSADCRSIIMNTAEIPNMATNSAPEVIESATDILSTINTVDNESIKKSETEVSCQSVDELSTDISENIIMETKEY